MSHVREPDLAAIILDGEARRRTGWRSRVRARAEELRVPRAHEYDATSVGVLVLAMLGIALILGFAANALRDDDSALPVTAAAPVTEGALQAPGAALVAEAGSDAATKPRASVAVVPPGVDLVASRITATKTPGRYGATIRVRVANTGGTALTAERGSFMTVLVDGAVVAVRPLTLGAATADGPAARSEAFQLASCTAGTHAVTVVVDANARVDEAREGDNASSAQLDWTC